MNNLVSIIMPSYNTEKYIAESIKSVQAQTYTNWELIIVDDFSNDGTESVVERFLSDKRIKFVKGKENRGAAACRNKALRVARGKWIAFLDSDDLWESQKLEKQIAFMEKNNYHFSYTEYSEMDAEGNDTGITVSGPPHISKKKMFDYCWPGCLTVMYDASTLGFLQIKEIRKNNDYAMWLKLCKKSRCHLLKENLARYRRGRASSISTNSYVELIKWHFRLYRICEEESIIISVFNTVRNLIWGLYKKIRYVKK